MKDKILVSRDMLERCLAHMERDWWQIDGEWGPTKGGLDAEIAKGNEPEIAELRTLLSGTA